MNERQFQTRIIDLAEWSGWMVSHFSDSRRQIRPGVFVGDRQAKGFPDLVLAHPRHGVAFAEVKTDTGVVRPEQRAWITRLHTAGAVAFIWRPRMWPEIERFLRDGGPDPVGAGYPRQDDVDQSAGPIRAATPPQEVPA